MAGTDYHIHTHYVGCANATMTIPAIIERCRQLGRTSIAITDHCDSELQLLKNRLIREEVERTDTAGLEVFFGCELNVLDRDGRLALDDKAVRREGFEVVVAGPHTAYPADGDTLLRVIERYTGLMCAVAANPVVDVLVHPWWLSWREYGETVLNTFTSFELVPDELICRLAETCVRHGTAVELNGTGILAGFPGPPSLRQSYPAFVARLVELGCSISLGSDSHDIANLATIDLGTRLLAEIGIPDAQVWRPKARPALVGSKLCSA